MLQKQVKVQAAELGPRQVRVRCSTALIDRAGEVVVQDGISHAESVPVLWQHDPNQPVGRAYPVMVGGDLHADVMFAPEGISAKADEICGLVKSAVIDTVSIGFDPVDAEPMDPKKPRGPQKYLKSELLELSFVSVPANKEAAVVQRAKSSKEPDWKCGAADDLPLDEKSDWDGAEAKASIFEACGFDGDSPDGARAAKYFLVHDAANPGLKGSYKLPFAKIEDGKAFAVAAGIRNAASRLPQTEGLPDAVSKEARAVLDGYEEKMSKDEEKARAAAVAKMVDGIKAKGMWQVGRLADLLAQLGWQVEDAQWESAIEEDNSAVPQMLSDALRQLADAFLAMAAEEVSELLHDDDEDDVIDAIDVLPTADAEIVLAGKTVAIQKFRAGRALMKAWTIPVGKSGKKISAATEKAIKDAQDMHSQGVDLMKQGIAMHKKGMKAMDDVLADTSNTETQSTGEITENEGDTNKASLASRRRDIELLAVSTA